MNKMSKRRRLRRKINRQKQHREKNPMTQAELMNSVRKPGVTTGRAGAHNDSRTKRKRTRSAARRAAIRDQSEGSFHDSPALFHAINF